MDLLQQLNNFNTNLQQHMLQKPATKSSPARGGGPLGDFISNWQQLDKRNELDRQVDGLFDETGALTSEGLLQYDRAGGDQKKLDARRGGKGVTNQSFRQAIDEKLIGGATGARQLEREGIEVYDPETGIHRSGVDLLRAKKLQDSRKADLIEAGVTRPQLGAGFEGGFGVLDVSDDVFAAKVKSVAESKKTLSTLRDLGVSDEEISAAGGDTAKLKNLIREREATLGREKTFYETDTTAQAALRSDAVSLGLGEGATPEEIRAKKAENFAEDYRAKDALYEASGKGIRARESHNMTLGVQAESIANSRLNRDLALYDRDENARRYKIDRADQQRYRNQEIEMRKLDLEVERDMVEDARQQNMINNLLGGLFNLGSLL